MLALNVRSNHVHALVSAENPVERVMNSLKAWSTRYLREAELVDHERTLWTRHGSTKWLFSDESVELIIAYIRDGQGPDLPGAITISPPPR